MGLNISLSIEVDTGGDDLFDVCLYQDSVSHNYLMLWKEVGLSDILYKADGKQAGELIDILSTSISKILSTPEKCAFIPISSYEDLDGAIEFLNKLCEACKQHPNATVNVSL